MGAKIGLFGESPEIEVGIQGNLARPLLVDKLPTAIDEGQKLGGGKAFHRSVGLDIADLKTVIALRLDDEDEDLDDPGQVDGAASRRRPHADELERVFESPGRTVQHRLEGIGLSRGEIANDRDPLVGILIGAGGVGAQTDLERVVTGIGDRHGELSEAAKIPPTLGRKEGETGPLDGVTGRDLQQRPIRSRHQPQLDIASLQAGSGELPIHDPQHEPPGRRCGNRLCSGQADSRDEGRDEGEERPRSRQSHGVET
jgi:hypothetical protein